MSNHQASYDKVYVYSMGRPGFILQYVADAFTAQTANADSKPISVVFALVGLYLHVERKFSGRQVQRVHMELGRKKRVWPTIALPEHRGTMTVLDVLAAPEGTKRDLAIDDWCRSVWLSFSADHRTIMAILRDCRII